MAVKLGMFLLYCWRLAPNMFIKLVILFVKRVPKMDMQLPGGATLPPPLSLGRLDMRNQTSMNAQALKRCNSSQHSYYVINTGTRCRDTALLRYTPFSLRQLLYFTYTPLLSSW